MSRRPRKPFIGDFEDVIRLLESLKERTKELNQTNYRKLESGMVFDMGTVVRKVHELDLQLMEYLNNIKD